ncbi:MAG: ATP-dependent DNA ligase [Microbacterium sp.]
MGSFIYDTTANAVEIDDRTLAHLRVVIMNKLRRSEPFMFDIDMHDGSGRRSFWVHQSVPLQFRFFSNRPTPLNRLWIEALMESASGPNGLTIVPEPEETPDAPAAAPRAARKPAAKKKAPEEA